MCVCVCVCVCEWKREEVCYVREKGKEGTEGAVCLSFLLQYSCIALVAGSRGDTQPDSQPVQSWPSSAEPQS